MMTPFHNPTDYKWTVLTVTASTNFIEMSPSWKAASCAATQEFTNILWKPKANYRVQKIP
jgi:hypothetical protein